MQLIVETDEGNYDEVSLFISFDLETVAKSVMDMVDKLDNYPPLTAIKALVLPPEPGISVHPRPDTEDFEWEELLEELGRTSIAVCRTSITNGLYKYKSQDYHLDECIMLEGGKPAAVQWLLQMDDSLVLRYSSRVPIDILRTVRTYGNTTTLEEGACLARIQSIINATPATAKS